jgi:hypothetical protein
VVRAKRGPGEGFLTEIAKQPLTALPSAATLSRKGRG